MKASTSVQEVGIHATALSLAEIGLGSILHALHVPFTGTFLSLNQIFLLTRHLCITQNRRRTLAPFSISTNAALFKSLAPIGKKLTPMVAICMQGMLYNLGILFFGNTFLGRLTGGVASSFWGFFQPLFLYWLFFGKSLFLAAETFVWMKDLFWGLLIGKALAAVLIVLFTPLLPHSRFERYFQVLSRSLDELKKLPTTTQITKHNCIQGWTGVAEWTGVSMSEIIRLVQPTKNALYVVFRSYQMNKTEAPEAEGEVEYYGCLDLKEALYPQTILAYEMNGVPLPQEYGAPLRLRMETKLGYRMVKWIKSIEFVDDYKKIGLGYGGFREDHEYDDHTSQI